MGTWNSDYELEPRNVNNPGYGAQSIRELKSNITERMERFNIWSDAEASTGVDGGTPKEGAARSTVEDTGSSGRDDRVSSSTALIGQIVMELNPRSSERQRDGVDFADTDQDNTANLDKIIRVVMNDDTLGTKVVPIFKYDSMVDIYQDQTIDGRKTFTLSPNVPSIVDWKDAANDPEKQQYAVNVKEAYDNGFAGKYFNSLNADDADNIAENADYSSSGGYDDNAFINTNVHVNQIEAKSIKGVIWV